MCIIEKYNVTLPSFPFLYSSSYFFSSLREVLSHFYFFPFLFPLFLFVSIYHCRILWVVYLPRLILLRSFLHSFLTQFLISLLHSFHSSPIPCSFFPPSSSLPFLYLTLLTLCTHAPNTPYVGLCIKKRKERKRRKKSEGWNVEWRSEKKGKKKERRRGL